MKTSIDQEEEGTMNVLDTAKSPYVRDLRTLTDSRADDESEGAATRVCQVRGRGSPTRRGRSPLPVRGLQR